jgi:hypothetical protein
MQKLICILFRKPLSLESTSLATKARDAFAIPGQGYKRRPLPDAMPEDSIGHADPSVQRLLQAVDPSVQRLLQAVADTPSLTALILAMMPGLCGMIQWHRWGSRCPQGCPMSQVAPVDDVLGVQPPQRTSEARQSPGCPLAISGRLQAQPAWRRWSSAEAISRRVSPDRRSRGLALSPKG